MKRKAVEGKNSPRPPEERMKMAGGEKKRNVRVKDPLYYLAVLALAATGMLVSIVRTGDLVGGLEEKLVFLVFALCMVYLGPRL